MVDCIVFAIVYIVGVIVVIKEIEEIWELSDIFTSILFVSSVLSIAVLSLFDFADKVKNIDFVIAGTDLSFVAVGMAIVMVVFFIATLVVRKIKREKVRRTYHGVNF